MKCYRSRFAFAALLTPVSWNTIAHAQLVIVDDIPAVFQDISQTGTFLDIQGDETALINTTIGNLVFPVGDVWVGMNGALGFDPPLNTLPPDNETIPSNNLFGGGQAAVVYWDDLDRVGNDATGAYWQEIDGKLIVQWNTVDVFPFDGATATFQVQIPDTSLFAGPPIFAHYIYPDISQPGVEAASASIGYQAGGVFNNVPWSFNTAGAVVDGTVLTLTVPGPGVAASLAVVWLVPRRRRRRGR